MHCTVMTVRSCTTIVARQKPEDTQAIIGDDAKWVSQGCRGCCFKQDDSDVKLM